MNKSIEEIENKDETTAGCGMSSEVIQHVLHSRVSLGHETLNIFLKHIASILSYSYAEVFSRQVSYIIRL